MYRMNGYEIEDMIYGATLLGGGGGGACGSGLMALDQYMEDHAITDKADVMVQVLSVDEMDENGYAACTAAMGAPTKFKEVRIAPYILGSFDRLGGTGDKLRRDLRYSISVEIGGFNTLVPLLVAMEKGIPFIDADGAGRAVPALDTLLLHVNGLPTSPLAMSDNKGNGVDIYLKNGMDAAMGEAIGRNLCVAFDQMGGLSGWMVKKNEIQQNLPVGSVTLCRKIGHVMKTAGTAENIFGKLKQEAGVDCMELDRGQVVDVGNEQANGFDKGFVKIKGSKGVWTTYFLNENLIVELDGKTVMTVPDVICYCDAKTGVPLSNADIVGKKGEILVKDVVLGAVKVNEKWWNNGYDYIQKIWAYYFKLLDHEGQSIMQYPPKF